MISDEAVRLPGYPLMSSKNAEKFLADKDIIL